MNKNSLLELKNSFLQALSTATTLTQLEQLRVSFLGRSGKITELMDLLKQATLEQKREFGPLLNELKQVLSVAFNEKKQAIESELERTRLAKEKNFDVTAHLANQPLGSLHPLTRLIEHVENVLISIGFTIIHGPEVDTEFYNFEALNIPEGHPARDFWNTFWLKTPGLLLRPHTSSVQIHAMKHHKPPFAFAAPGRVFRHEAIDATHDCQFHQVEGLIVDHTISMAHLLGVLKTFFQGVFDTKTLQLRVRPSYFPFVEPGIEVDISCLFCKSGCAVCKHTGWIEIGGAGLVHPNVLESCGVNSQLYSGCAFGLGLERIAMLLYKIDDIRLFTGSHVPFLAQF